MCPRTFLCACPLPFHPRVPLSPLPSLQGSPCRVSDGWGEITWTSCLFSFSTFRQHPHPRNQILPGRDGEWTCGESLLGLAGVIARVLLFHLGSFFFPFTALLPYLNAYPFHWHLQ